MTTHGWKDSTICTTTYRGQEAEQVLYEFRHAISHNTMEYYRLRNYEVPPKRTPPTVLLRGDNSCRCVAEDGQGPGRNRKKRNGMTDRSYLIRPKGHDGKGPIPQPTYVCDGVPHGYKARRMLIDVGSSVNVVSVYTLRAINIEDTRDKGTSMEISDFNANIS
uniref:Uncharacterized protein n=1 Tax=Nelumbo nucifera TaxID=4432 RepID=A0A822YFG8_NELNU|nr:TPA_asm: hypothetical protein HUJ06_031173 [Nelumbo nucifera]